jgi:hypothetical protein
MGNGISLERGFGLTRDDEKVLAWAKIANASKE